MNEVNKKVAMENVDRSRREALRKTAMIMGAALSAPVIASVMSGCKRTVGRDWTPAFFSAEEADLVTALTMTMFPKTETPGALEAGIGSFIDLTLQNNMEAKDQKAFKTGLQSLVERCKSEKGKDFVQLSDEDRMAFLNVLEKERAEQKKNDSSRPGRDKMWKFDGPSFFHGFRELAIAGYFSSEAVAKNYFVYDPIPTKYEGCIDFDTVGAAWAL